MIMMISTFFKIDFYHVCSEVNPGQLSIKTALWVCVFSCASVYGRRSSRLERFITTTRHYRPAVMRGRGAPPAAGHVVQRWRRTVT